MAAFTTILGAAALGLGAASTVSSAITAKKTQKAQAAAQAKQEAQAKNAAALSATRDETGADVVFGTNTASDKLLRRGTRATKSKTTSKKVVSRPTKVGGLS